MPIDTVQKFNVIPDFIINECIDDYNSKDKRHPGVMNTADPGIHIGKISNIVEDILGKKIQFKSGNYYQHDKPYLPHTDWFSHLDNNLNVVIPLQIQYPMGHSPSLVVFDQKWRRNGVTWCMHHPVLDFCPNTGVKGNPNEYPVENKTGLAMPYDFKSSHLPHYHGLDLFGLSGQAYSFTRGSAIIFDNQRIHCTSYFKGTKLGLSLRYKL